MTPAAYALLLTAALALLAPLAGSADAVPQVAVGQPLPCMLVHLVLDQRPPFFVNQECLPPLPSE